MHAVLSYFFHWYTGQVWPNLIASAITTPIGLVIAYVKLKRYHRRSQAALHNHISQEFENLRRRTDKTD